MMSDEEIDVVGDEEALEDTIALAVDGEDHTLGNVLRDVMWSHPHVEVASYTREHPTSNEVVIRCQTSGAISAEQGVVEALVMAKQMLEHVGETMTVAVRAFEQRAPPKSDAPGG